MNITPKITVVIPFYNCPYLHQAIESVRSQSYPNVEIIVVDDGSTEHQQQVIPYLPYIRYFIKPNGGTASALNFGIKQATGDYFAWLSSDDRFTPDKLEKQMKFFQDHQAYVGYTAYYYMNADGERTSEPIRCIYTSRRHMFETLMNVNPINGISIMIKMNVFSAIGVFDEKLRYTHDYDLWLRILPHFELYYLDEPLLYYRSHVNMGSIKYAKDIQSEIDLVQSNHRASILNLIKEGK